MAYMAFLHIYTHNLTIGKRQTAFNAYLFFKAIFFKSTFFKTVFFKGAFFLNTLLSDSKVPFFPYKYAVGLKIPLTHRRISFRKPLSWGIL
jgi:hypothetical protein